MFFDSSPISKGKAAETPREEKDSLKPPKTPFRDFLSKRTPPKKPSRENIFELVKKNASKQPEGIALPPLSLQTSSSAEQLEASSLLSVHMQELFEKMVDFIQLESEKGISTTTVMIEMEDSPFNGSEITIKHYDTAPHSFTIQLSGSSEAIADFHLNLPALLEALQVRLETFQINLLPPYLNEFKTQSGVKKGKKVDKLRKSVHKVK